MLELSQLFFAVVAAYVYAIIAVPLLRMPTRIGRFAAVCTALLVLSCPLLISREKIAFRAIAAFVCVELCLKMVDYSRQYGRRRGGESADFAAYLRFLIPFPALLVVFGERERRLPSAPPLREIAVVCLMGCLVAAGFAVVRIVSQAVALRTCFPLDHAVKLLIFAVTIASLSRFLWGLERLARFDTRPIIDGAFSACTPSEFWGRYNTRVAEWMRRNLFQSSDGGRAPCRGVLITFFASGILHELAFAIATSRFTGYQFTFFMIQAPAVILSHRLKPSLRRSGLVSKIAMHSLTVVWFYVTSVFFFEGVNRVFPLIYASHPWLP